MRLPADAPARKATRYFFDERTNKNYPGRKRRTIVTTINEDIKRTKNKDPTFPASPLISHVRTLHKSKEQKNCGSELLNKLLILPPLLNLL